MTRRMEEKENIMAESIQCSRCRYANAPGAAFCGNCGAALPAVPPPPPPEATSAACPFCGSRNPVGAAFCGECGLALGGSLAPVVVDERSGRGRGLLVVALVFGLLFLLAGGAWLVWPRLGLGQPDDDGLEPTAVAEAATETAAPITKTAEPREEPIVTIVEIDVRATELAQIFADDATLVALEMAYPPPPVLTEEAAIEASTAQAEATMETSTATAATTATATAAAGATITAALTAAAPPPAPALPDEIVFQSNRDDDYEIYIMNVDGSNQRQLTFNTIDDRFPRVSPDGRSIVYQSGRGSLAEIFVMNRDGSDQRRLTFNEDLDELPTWSPDGQRIVFVTWVNDNNSELFVIDADGGNVRQITDTTVDEGYVNWSAAGLVFNGTESGTSNYQLYRSDADGGNRQRLTNSGIDEWSPMWSPNGSQILFLSERGSSVNSGIYVMDAATGEARPIYNNEDRRLLEWGAVWSVDGGQIVFAMDQTDGSADIYIMDADGTDVRRLTERGGYPAWAPGTD